MEARTNSKPTLQIRYKQPQSLTGRPGPAARRGMINDLLDVNRINLGQRLSLELSECDIEAIIHDLVEELKLIHGDRFVLKSEGTARQGYWDCNKVRRILENLSINAIKYGDSKAPVTIEIAAQGKEEIRFSVHNHGNPIAKEDISTLFEPFKRAGTAKGRKGWGLGLTAVKTLTEAHGGRLGIESDEKSGTTFSIIMPRDSRSIIAAEAQKQTA